MYMQWRYLTIGLAMISFYGYMVNKAIAKELTTETLKILSQHDLNKITYHVNSICTARASINIAFYFHHQNMQAFPALIASHIQEIETVLDHYSIQHPQEKTFTWLYSLQNLINKTHQNPNYKSQATQSSFFSCSIL